MSGGEPQGPLDDLDARLRKARAESKPSAGDGKFAAGGSVGGFGTAFRIGIELLAALVVGVGIGLLLDDWLGTKPWFLVVFFFIGAGAGIVNVYRAASGIGLAAGYRTPPEPTAAPDNRREKAGGKRDERTNGPG